jgi:hypothetical protein
MPQKEWDIARTFRFFDFFNSESGEWNMNIWSKLFCVWELYMVFVFRKRGSPSQHKTEQSLPKNSVPRKLDPERDLIKFWKFLATSTPLYKGHCS